MNDAHIITVTYYLKAEHNGIPSTLRYVLSGLYVCLNNVCLNNGIQSDYSYLALNAQYS